MGVFFTSDLHLGHRFGAKARGFNDTLDHDLTIVQNINNSVHKNDKLFVLGDVLFSDSAFGSLHMINCRNTEMLFGNHDQYPIKKYLGFFSKIHGFRSYRQMWLSHCPIHPQEVFRFKGNIHGHIHNGGATGDLEDPRYYNVNVDFNDLKPVPLEVIEEHYAQIAS